jgi:hypothetical protein
VLAGRQQLDKQLAQLPADANRRVWPRLRIVVGLAEDAQNLGVGELGFFRMVSRA